MIYMIVVPLTIYVVYQILRLNGVFDNTRGLSEHSEDRSYRNRNRSKRNNEKRRLSAYSITTNFFRGLCFSAFKEEQHLFYIERLAIKSKILDRNYTPAELRGKYVLRLVIGTMCIPLGYINKLFFAIPIIALYLFITYEKGLEMRVEEEDKIIEDNFSNLYLMIFSKLRQGSRARLMPTIQSYIATVENSMGGKEKDVMLRFLEFFLNCLSMEEDQFAVMRIRERYKSPTMINFCNIASQALNGIDNYGSLLTMKQELTNRVTVQMEKRAEKLGIKCQRAVYSIYIVLGTFVLIGWYSKLPLDFF